MQKIIEKKMIKFFLLLIIPVILFLTSIAFIKYQGPYFMNYDPGYVYLISSLNLSQLQGVAHIDHPGTPLQILGAGVIKLSYIMSGQKVSIAFDVLYNPEKYMFELNLLLLILNCTGLLILGIVSQKVYSDVNVSLLLQLTPFTTVTIISMLTLYRPENFLFFVICIFISALILFANEIDLNSKKSFRYVLLIGIISGLGVATKINIFPMLLIPFLLIRGIKYKLIFIIISFFSFLLFVLPAVSTENVNYFLQWVYSLFLYDKKYGRGAPVIIDTGSFLYNIKRILIAEWFFVISYISVFVSMIVSLISGSGNLSERFRNSYSNNNYRLALGIFITMSLQIIVVAKHFGEYYMFPVLMLSVFGIVISYSVLSESGGKKFTEKSKLVFLITVIVLISAQGVRTFYRHGTELNTSTDKANGMMKYIKENLSNEIVVFAKYAPDKGFALLSGTLYAGTQMEKYQSMLEGEYPGRFYYKNDHCYSFSNDSAIVKNAFKSADKIYFVCPVKDNLNVFLKLLERDYGIFNRNPEVKFDNSSGVAVYEIKFDNY